jgi:hypothetical protein
MLDMMLPARLAQPMAIETQFSVRALLEQHFGGPIKIAPELTLELIEKVIAASGIGLNHTIGERVLAVGDNSRAHELEDFFVLTDRRIAGRHWRVFFHAELDEITNVVEGTSFAIPKLVLHTSGRIVEVKMGLLSRELGAYLNALCQLPPGVRTPPTDPIPVPTAADLASDQWVKANAGILGPACEQMLWIVTVRFRRGEIALEAARNFIARIVLQSRNSVFGRGMLSGWWMSPLPIADLQQAIQQLLGRPKREFQQVNLFTSEFSLSDGGAAGKAAASSAAGLAAAAFLGVGWISIPAKSVSQLRVSLSSGPGMTCIELQGTSSKRFEPVSVLQPRLLAKLLELLGRYEQALLYRRALFDWEEHPAQLMSKTPDEVQERLTRLTV